MKKILGCVKRAQSEFNMIEEGDVVAVGLSGGKDSMTLLKALNLYRNFAPVHYELKAITVDMGFEGFDTKKLEAFCRENEAEFIPESTRLGPLIFEERQEKGPCGMCSRMRRGILNRVCEENGVTKLALGHHGDDLLETFFLSLVYEGRVNAFKAVTPFERTPVVQIRPLIYAEETDVIDAALRHRIPIVKNPCPASGVTKRQEMKDAIDDLVEKTGQPRSRMIRALCRSDLVR